MFAKRGSAVLDAPEESYAPEGEWVAPEPAPPGTLHPGLETRSSVPSLLPEQPGRNSSRRSQIGYRLRVGVPGSTAGRVALGMGLVFFLGLAAAGGLAARYSVLHDSQFIIAGPENIQTEGNKHLTREEIINTFSGDLYRNLFRSSLAERQADLQRLPWVEHATVMRLLPNRIRVRIQERTPVAFFRQGSRIGLVDAGGVLLDMPQDAAGDPKYSFPVLTGLSSSDPLSTRFARTELYLRFMHDLDEGGETLSRNISEVDVSNPEDVKAIVASGSTDLLVHFGDEDFLQRYRLFQEHLPAWKQQYPKLAAVDTRYEHQMVLEMAQGVAAPLAGTDGRSNEELKGNLLSGEAERVHGRETNPSTARSHGEHKPVKR